MEPANTKRATASTTKQVVLVALVAGLVLGLSAGAGWFVHSRLAHAPTTSEDGAGNAERLAHGKLLFQVYCASCHGSDGHGDGPSAQSLKPPPRDFSRGAWRFGTSPAALRKVIADGIPGTPMPGMGRSLSPQDLDALLAFVLAAATNKQVQAVLPANARAMLQRAGFTPAATLQPAPPLQLCDTNGDRLSLASFRGKVVLVNFWGTTCIPCLAELPAWERLEEEFHDRGVAVLCVCADEQDMKSVSRVARQHVKHLPVYVDPLGSARVRYDVQVMPTAFLIDREGRLLGSAQGARDWTGSEVKDLLGAYLD